MRNFLRIAMCFFLVVLQLTSSGCIHVSPNEIQPINLRKEEAANVNPEKSNLEYVIYRATELPLEDFFYNFRKGEYKKAFKEIKLNYRPSNFSNKALEELVAAGFIPVYINMTNKGAHDLQFDEKSFHLIDGKTQFTAINVNDLPREFQHFSPTALAANVYNTGVVVVGFAALVAAFVIATANSSYGYHTDMTGAVWPSLPKNGDPVYNDLNRVTKVDYQDYLISSTTLKPGESRQGLVFFFAPDVPRDQDFQLVFK